MKILGCICLALFAFAALGEPAIPDTPAGRTFAAWLASFNSADAAQVAVFIEKYKRESDVEGVLSFRAYTGGFDLLRIQDSKPDLLLALLKERDSDRGMHFKLTRVGGGTGKELVMDLHPVPLPPEFAPPRLSQNDVLTALTVRADEFAREDRFSGALLIARHGEILLQKSWGYADRESKAPVTLDTQFRLGSMNKMFTAVGVLQLVEAGKLSLDAPLGQYLADYPNKEVASKVKVRHLLTHTGGTGDFFGPEFAANRERLREHDDYVRLLGKRGLEFEPGTSDRYSNFGYVLLGALIEKVSGMSYYDYMRRKVYAPAGMRSTDSLPETETVSHRATGYMKNGGAWVRNDDTMPYRGMAAGGGYSTVGDLLRFSQALQSGKLISMQMLAEATRPQDNGKTYGYGFGIRGAAPLLQYGHGGGAPGMNGTLSIYPQLGYVLVGLSNFDPPTARNMVEYFASRMPIEQ
jgi:CubicO group peptidase (beta-lactamase class C family)